MYFIEFWKLQKIDSIIKKTSSLWIEKFFRDLFMACNIFKELPEDELIASFAFENDPDIVSFISLKFVLINSNWALNQVAGLLFFIFFRTYLNKVGLESFRIFSDARLEFDITFKFNLIDNCDNKN